MSLNNSSYKKLTDHAFFSASQYGWLKFDSIEDVQRKINNQLRTRDGTDWHEGASWLINHKVKVTNKQNAWNKFVNDCVNEGMKSEVLLKYSDFFFGTTDAIRFKDNTLYIYDLKTGVNKAKFDQLYIYAALFCLQEGYDPRLLDYVILRIYQFEDYEEISADPEYIFEIMGKIIDFDRYIMTLPQDVQDRLRYGY